MARGVNVGMVMSGRAARACDSCGSERARWYCAADEAYLCERCDAAVHTANPVARRHDRARLAPNGAPLKIQRSTLKKLPQPQLQPQSLPPGPLPPTRKRPRTPRTHPALLHTNPPHLALPATVPSLPPLPKTHRPPQPVHIKPEPPSSPSLDVQVPDHTHLLESLFDLHDDSLFLHEVPIFTQYSDTTEHKPSLLHHDHDFSLQDEKPTRPEDAKPTAAASSSLIRHSCQEEDIDDKSAVQRQHEADERDTLHGRAADEPMDHFLVPGNCIDIEHFLDSASPNLSELESEIDGMMAEHTEADQAGNPSADDRLSEDGSYGETAGYGGDDHHQANMAAAYREVCYGGESPRSWLCKVKVESPPELEEDIINGDEFAHELVILSQKLSKDDDTQKDDHEIDHHDISKRPKLGLRLDIEAVLNAWSDKGSLWMDGQRPDESSLDCLGEWLVPDTNYFNSSIQRKTDQLGLVPVMQKESIKASGAAREARVMRYREKRRNRLFSKKIRYEVRKLNAEKRPRMKGRFVKRTPCMS